MDIEKILKDKKLKITPQRKAILEAFKKDKDVMDANTLFGEVLKLVPDINFSTVYRNLDTLVSKDILCKISRSSGGDLFKIRRDSKHHHHLICSSCGAVTSIEFCPLESIENELKGLGFSPEDHSFEIYGKCKKCK